MQGLKLAAPSKCGSKADWAGRYFTLLAGSSGYIKLFISLTFQLDRVITGVAG